MQRPKSRSPSHERWLISYADFITLLFAFFVVLYASAQVDRSRMSQLSFAIQTAFQDLGAFPSALAAGPAAGTAKPGAAPSNVAPNVAQLALQTEIEQALAKELQAEKVSIYITPDGLVISLRELGFFETGSAQLKPEAHNTFAKVAGVLLRGSSRLRIEGHTDNQPIHNERFSSNWELSTARATEVIRVLVTEYGFPPDRLAAAGYGEFHPIADNASAVGRASNRRVDIVIISESQS